MALYPGGHFTLTYYGGLPNAPAFMSLGIVGAGGTWQGLPLPINLRPYGAPRCYWTVASLISLPFSFDGSGVGPAPSVPLPNQPAIAGLRFFEQALVIDPQANALGATAVGSAQWEIGTGIQPSVSTLVSFDDFPPSSVALWKFDRAPIVRFSH